MNHYCDALEQLRRRPTHKLKEVGDQWRTPDPIFWGINAIFGPLVLDLFADESNTKCAAYYTAEENALAQDWSARLAELNGAAFGNPPYSRASQHDGHYITGMRHIMAYAEEMRERGGRYIFLIKSATAEVWWPEGADHISLIRGRISFDLPTWYRPGPDEPAESSAGFGAAIAVLDKAWRGAAWGYVNRDDLIARGETVLAQMRWMAPRFVQPQIQTTDIDPVPETAASVWPAEVHFLFNQVPAAGSLPAGLQNKVRSHINRMKLDGMAADAIIQQTIKLTAAMGATA